MDTKRNNAGTFGTPGQKHPNDIVIISALRTPLTKAKKGALKDSTPELMVAHVLQAVVKQAKLDPSLVEDVVVGNALQPTGGALTARIGQLLANFPTSVPIATVNRQCSSGLEACSIIASKISCGLIEIGIGSGVESMSMYDMQSIFDPNSLSDAVFDVENARNCLIPMGETSEILNDQDKLTRLELDTYAVETQNRAFEARKNGFFKDEIVPMKVKSKATGVEVLVTEDDGIRQTTVEALSKLKPSFRTNGLSHAGNSSQMTDGAAAVLLMSRRAAEKLGMKIIGKFISHSVVGVPPEIMGVGPAVAIPKAVASAGLQISDIDIFEINEAFASVAIYTMKKLKLDPKKVNPKGGAIAFGHPLGCTGARQFSTLLTELHRTKKRFGIISMCIGTGMGAAAVIERED